MLKFISTQLWSLFDLDIYLSLTKMSLLICISLTAKLIENLHKHSQSQNLLHNYVRQLLNLIEIWPFSTWKIWSKFCMKGTTIAWLFYHTNIVIIKMWWNLFLYIQHGSYFPTKKSRVCWLRVHWHVQLFYAFIISALL